MVIGGSTPASSAVLDLQSTNKGFAPPRMDNTQKLLIVNPVTGLIIYNTTFQSLEINVGTSAAPYWQRFTLQNTQPSVETSMAVLPPGFFSMGCIGGDANCASRETPNRFVSLSPFEMGITEVTQSQWNAVMGSNNSTFSYPVCADCPMETVSWFDALVFCNALSEARGLTPCYYSDAGFTQVYGKSGFDWTLPNTGTVYWNPSAKGYRLPTEAEWEYAARGNKLYIYSGSATLDLVSWHGLNSSSKTNPVKKLFQNGFGLYDMSGNVFEWCWDWFGTYPSTAETNPSGPSSGANKILRGGCYNVLDTNHRVTYRYDQPANFRSSTAGFRIARTL
jgi:sulfatase modifying factor 1